ncbi:MAG: DUF3307 domain-containing protein [Wenzhouxiangella sp.]|nr:MAG: DUF3307 domain-containing protein [Wenzhouxiangella sp.]
MFTANQIVAHFVGDYLLQSDWMAQNKHQRLDAAILHVIFYTLPFLFITQEPIALALIALTHLVVDYFGLARYLAWLKNRPWPGSRPWKECRDSGFPPEMPKWQSSWLVVIIDNTVHILCNGVVIYYFG